MAVSPEKDQRGQERQRLAGREDAEGGVEAESRWQSSESISRTTVPRTRDCPTFFGITAAEVSTSIVPPTPANPVSGTPVVICRCDGLELDRDHLARGMRLSGVVAYCGRPATSASRSGWMLRTVCRAIMNASARPSSGVSVSKGFRQPTATRTGRRLQSSDGSRRPMASLCCCRFMAAAGARVPSNDFGARMM